MLTKQVVLDIPEKVLIAEKTDINSFGEELRTLAAIKLFELGRLSSGRAAELAGISRVEFLFTLEPAHKLNQKSFCIPYIDNEKPNITICRFIFQYILIYAEAL